VIRPAAASDIPAIHRLIRDLAEYERAPHEVKATEQDLRDALLAKPLRGAGLRQARVVGAGLEHPGAPLL
jgi:N-acetylglutamate synthase-like GNAT family acetyltransferase